MIDHQEQFIEGKVQKYLRACMQNKGWIHFSKNKCTAKHRPEIFIRVQSMLTLMGINYDLHIGVYKLKIVENNKMTVTFYYGLKVPNGN